MGTCTGLGLFTAKSKIIRHNTETTTSTTSEGTPDRSIIESGLLDTGMRRYCRTISFRSSGHIANRNINGAAKLDHFGAVKLDQLRVGTKRFESGCRSNRRQPAQLHRGNRAAGHWEPESDAKSAAKSTPIRAGVENLLNPHCRVRFCTWDGTRQNSESESLDGDLWRLCLSAGFRQDAGVVAED